MLTMRQISDAILNAVQRGVRVRMITDYSMIHSSGTQINRLQERGSNQFISVFFSLHDPTQIVRMAQFSTYFQWYFQELQCA